MPATKHDLVPGNKTINNQLSNENQSQTKSKKVYDNSSTIMFFLSMVSANPRGAQGKKEVNGVLFTFCTGKNRNYAKLQYISIQLFRFL